MAESETGSENDNLYENLDALPRLQALLPKLHEDQSYRVYDYKEDGNTVQCTLRLPLTTKDDALKWLKNFQETSFSTWRVDKTYPHAAGNKAKNIYRVDLRCQHNTYAKSSTADHRKGSKNTKCPSKLYVIVKKTFDVRGRCRSKDVHIREGFPTIINLIWDHNHEVECADAFRKRDVNDTTKEKLLELFRAGHSPSSALDTLKYDLQSDNTNEEYLRLSADKSICPDLQYCYRPAGSLPLGVVVTSSESQSTLTAAFKLLNSILPEDAFFGSADGPDIFMTDDCKVLRMALNSVYPRFYPCAKDVQMESIDQVGDKEFRVRSAKENEAYDVNMEIGICTCPSGRTGAPFKHQAAIMKNYGLDSANFLPVHSPEMRKLYYYMATGESTVDERWFQPLHSGLLETNNSEEMISVEESECITDAMADTETNTTSVGDQDPKIVCIQSLQAQAQLINQFGASQRNQTHQRNQEPILEEQLQNTFESLAASLRNDEGEELRNACKKFVSNYQKLTTRSHLISALQTFGKYSRAATSLRRTYKSGRALQTSSKIGVQPTAVARRKMPMGGRRRLTVGRPSKSSFTSEHGYSKRALSLTRSSLPHGKRLAAPHSLSHCVSSNISLGKTHSSK
ncbi:hypothetical protein HOLleu_25583 [Holothuria leucospilota]|uniref:SWIM-type domain-containing protein n=1 Tax=Holothuria leucospilota TaxID=206669 RepID=A0A9Q1H3K8_HOLLE|nr:hypothetical protein HOLleu_25583 [Holothuria leucospilota]